MDVSGRHVSSQVLPGARGARLTAELPAYAAQTPDPAPVQPYPGRAQPTPWGPGLRALPSSPNEVTKGRVDQWILLLGQKRLPYSANLSSSFFSFFLIYLFAWKFIIDIPNCMHVCVRACARVPLWNGVTRAHRNAASNTRAVARCPRRTPVGGGAALPAAEPHGRPEARCCLSRDGREDPHTSKLARVLQMIMPVHKRGLFLGHWMFESAIL